MKKDRQSVTETGEAVAPRIHGLVTRRLATIEDARGESLSFTD